MTLAKNRLCSIILLITCFMGTARAQEWKTDKKIQLLFGLTQPLLLNGFNIEGNYVHNRLIFDYSHGVSLDFSGSAVTETLKAQGVVVHMPYTTGFGIGYRFTSWLNLRVEPKWHRFEFYYAAENQTSENEITSFNTFTLGLGLYGSIRPFKNTDSFLNGFLIAPSIRFWPTLSSSLKGSFVYENKNTQAEATIETPDPGIGFTPVVFNVSIGYSFQLKQKNG